MKIKSLAPMLCVWPRCQAPYGFAQDSTSVEVEKLKAMLAEQQKQIETLRQAVAQQQKMIEGLAKPAAQNAPSLVPAAPVDPATAPAVRRPLVASSTPMAVPDANPVPKFSPPLPQPDATCRPLQLKIGNISIMPVGFMDLTAVWRDKNAGERLGTQLRQRSVQQRGGRQADRIPLQPAELAPRLPRGRQWKGAHVIGYNEFDFLGTSGGNNLGVTNGAFVPRLRLFWVDVRKDQWEFLAGQSWSMLTPNRKGISALPGDLFYSQVMDVNYMVGLDLDAPTRRPLPLSSQRQDHVRRLSLENPDQYIGGSAGGRYDHASRRAGRPRRRAVGQRHATF